MFTCILCKEQKKSGQRFYYGFVCRNCKKTLPNLYPYKSLSEEQITWLHQNNKAPDFHETAKLGLLSIDEKRALFCLKKGFCNNVFSLLDCADISIEPTNIRQDSTGREIFCDVQIQFTLRSVNLYHKSIVKQREKCNVSPIMYDGRIQVREPVTVGLIRSMLNQSIENQFANGKLLLDKLSEMEQRKEQLLAMGTLMLPDGYTKEDVKKHRNSLIKAFHPDNNPDENAGFYTDRINHAYQVLKE